MRHDFIEAAVQGVLGKHRGRAPEVRQAVRVGPFAVSVPESESGRAADVLRALDDLGFLPARKVAQLFPDRATGNAVTLRTVLAWMRGQRAD
jgi:hypothetical protein